MRLPGTALVIAFLMLVGQTSPPLAAQRSADTDPTLTAEGVVTELYDLLTFEAGSPPDWDAVRSMFLDQAVVVLRTGRNETAVFSVDGFINDFVTFVESANLADRGFVERIVRTSPTVFGEIAHILVLYEASIPGSPRPPQQGVDSFQLIKKDGRWWVVGLINELPLVAGPVPPQLQQ